ncbi:MAG: hypothetical protein IJI36_18945 [Kiritimatiellae bacterium]|nr:hypothetical protein [Kiritimatiellia bacterium]
MIPTPLGKRHSCRFAHAVLLMEAALSPLCAADNSIYYRWRGTQENPVWSTSVANWYNPNSGSMEAWTSGSRAYLDPAPSGVTTDITVDDVGVVVGIYQEPQGGVYTFRGGPIYADPTLSIEKTASAVFYNQVMATNLYLEGSLTVGAGGDVWVASYIPTGANASFVDNSVLTVSTGGVLRVAAFDTSAIASKYSTLLVDGGSVSHYEQSVRIFGNSHLKVGRGGLRWRPYAERDHYVPGPVESACEDDGGVVFEQHGLAHVVRKGWYSSEPVNTHRGGNWIRTTGNVNFGADRNFGAIPESPTNNIFAEAGGNLVAENKIDLHENRNILIGAGVTIRFSVNSNAGDENSWIIHGTFSCADAKGTLRTIKGSNGEGPIVLAPPEGRTNVVGHLLAYAPRTIVASGVTEVNGASFSGVNDNASLNVGSGGHLMVTGGVLKVAGNPHCCNNGRLTVSGGLADFSKANVLNAYNSPATTTVCRAGTMVVSTFRVSGDTQSVYSDPSKSVLNIETGGVMRVLTKTGVCLVNNNRTGTVNFNGGMFEIAATGTDLNQWGVCSYPSDDLTKNNLRFTVREGGAVFSNEVCGLWFNSSLLSGAESDGGLEKWGAKELALMATNHTFNGSIRVMQGSFAVNTKLTNVFPNCSGAYVNGGATFRMNQSFHTFPRIGGGGRFAEMANRNLTVTRTIAPGMGPDAVGTLTISGGPMNIADGVALEIDVDDAGNSDCFSYPGELDLSKMSLRVNDVAKLDQQMKYVIATNLAGATGEFGATNLPSGWMVTYDAARHDLVLSFRRGTVISIR